MVNVGSQPPVAYGRPVSPPTNGNADFLPEPLARPHESEICEWVESLRDDASRRRDEDASFREWDTWENQWWGKQMWPEGLPSWKAPVNINEMKMVLLSELSDLTDSKLRVFVQKSHDNGDRDQMVEDAIQALWARDFIDHTLMLAALDAIKFPCGFIRTLWNPTADKGRGAIEVRVVPPKNVYPDPDAPDETAMQYLIIQDDMDLVEIRRLWPDHGFRVKPDSRYKLSDGAKGAGTGGVNYKGPLYAAGYGVGLEGYSKPRACVMTCFVKDPTIEDRLVDQGWNEDGTKKIERIRNYKYPNGRLIQIANGVVLYDNPNPYPDWTLTRICLDPSPNQFWPKTSIVGAVVPNYQAANKLDSAVLENALRLNGGKIIMDANAGLDPGKMSNIPGEVWMKNPSANISIMYPPQMPPDMINAGERLRTMTTQKGLGHNPSRSGMAGAGNVAADLVETEISQSMGLTRLRGRMLFVSVQRLSEQIFARMAQFYTVSRSMPRINMDGFSTVQWTPLEPSQRDAYSVHVDPASFQVRSKTMLQRLYLTLAKLGKIPNKQLLQMLEIPNADAVYEQWEKETALVAMSKGHLQQNG